MGYQLKITIKNSHPPIWRRILVPDRITFFNLDDIIEKAFGWTHGHMFAFDFQYPAAEFVGSPMHDKQDTADECIDEWMDEGRSFTYTYDFGDDWEHVIKVEKVVPYDKRYPQVLKYKGPNMVEDCGGIWGFYDYEDEAVPFDMERVNADYQKWNLPVVMETSRHVNKSKYDDKDDMDEWDMLKMLIGSLTSDDPEDMSGIEQWMDAMREHEDCIRENAEEIKSLEDIYKHYSKDNLIEIAKFHGFTGYRKLSKKDLNRWLKNHLLETTFMKNTFSRASEKELHLFESAIEQHGICLSDELMENSSLLMTYGGFNAALEFYQVPQDVQDKYKEICTPEFREECLKNQQFMDYCDAALFLYGVLPVEKFVEIYNAYEGANLNISEAVERIEAYIHTGEPYVLKEGLFMDEDLEEEDMFCGLLKKQEKYSYYIPEDREEFLAYGRDEFQKPDETVQFFMTYLQKKLHKKAPEDIMIYTYVQEELRMNASAEELIDTLVDCGCKISSQKQIEEAMKNLWKLGNNLRKWDYRGHTYVEIQKNEKIIAFPGTKKVYPNDPCPCGSGKKYKNCCGKK